MLGQVTEYYLFNVFTNKIKKLASNKKSAFLHFT
ncbi:hypothetical protein BCE_2909 [Bacillus cereus ATCC 10987]|uniref:Uncharacterized protein n=1 Tax=Bacillus cereus (strain ATCC 10987 / NRS 248) TaxID=222523 RepID=Q736J2_BACC1|nr:hypothetical protein BCE_2909 [Bacillus cereus ATCC 10987]